MASNAESIVIDERKQKIAGEDIFDSYSTIDEPLAKFIDRLNEIATKIGASPQDAHVLLQIDNDYGDCVLDCYVYRYETDAELQTRLAVEKREQTERESAYHIRREAEERAEYERLKAKFGEQSPTNTDPA